MGIVATQAIFAAIDDYPDIIVMLLDARADIEADEINCYGGKPLHWACSLAQVRVLLERGANVNSRNQKRDSAFYGMTPLIMNATQRNDCSEVTEHLIAAGADMGAADATGKTAFARAKERGLAKIQAVLRRHGAA